MDGCGSDDEVEARRKRLLEEEDGHATAFKDDDYYVNLAKKFPGYVVGDEEVTTKTSVCLSMCLFVCLSD